MADLSIHVRQLRGIGPRRAKTLEKLGIHTLADLIAWFPRRYEDRRGRKKIAELLDGESVCVSAVITQPPVVSYIRRGLDLLKIRAADDTGILHITFFNQIWLKRELVSGEEYVFYGKVEIRNKADGGAETWYSAETREMAEISTPIRAMANPVVERADRREAVGRIVPVYPLAAGVSQLVLRRCMREGLEAYKAGTGEEKSPASTRGDGSPALPDVLPDEIRAAHNLCTAEFAYENIHFPESEEALRMARRRLAFEELFVFTVGLRTLRGRREAARVEAFSDTDLTPFFSALPFQLTNAQRRCMDEAVSDFRGGKPMNRLCQGDVGAGKTMVAAACAYLCAKNRRQAALMAPTEILARQHYAGLSALLGPLGVRCALLTGSASAKERRDIQERLSLSLIDFVIGTHALISGGVSYAHLGLVITDEQHRFGVAQRSALAAKGGHPHTLVMSATPIPRTLALLLYGDLDVSILDELPPGRIPVATYAVNGSYHARIYRFLDKQIEAGGQIYIICPMAGESEEHFPEDRKAVTEYAAYLRERVFPQRRVAFVHGRMKAKEKDAVMGAFAGGETDILVSTTVVEVGVDVPNACVMVVENAERFGLSQLHQLRGRVGRGKRQSYCILISDNQSEETRRRLQVMARTNDGFQIAEEDLRLRGPGDFFGQRQHGLPGLKVADLQADGALLEEARKAAETLLAGDPDLSRYPAIADRAREMLARDEESMN